MATENDTTTTETEQEDVRVSLKQVGIRIAEVTGNPVGEEMKKLRAYVRSHFDDLQGEYNWPQEEKANRDSNRYAPMSEECAEHLFQAKAAKYFEQDEDTEDTEDTEVEETEES